MSKSKIVKKKKKGKKEKKLLEDWGELLGAIAPDLNPKQINCAHTHSDTNRSVNLRERERDTRLKNKAFMHSISKFLISLQKWISRATN